MIKVCINSSNCLLPIKHQGITETYGEPVHWCIKSSCAHVRYNGYQYQRNNGRHDAGANEVIKLIRLSHFRSWWHHQMEIFPTLLALCGDQLLLVNSTHKGQWRWALMLSFISAWTNGWTNNWDTGDLRPHRAQYDIIVMSLVSFPYIF